MAMKPCARKEEGTAMRNYSWTPDALAVVGTQALVVRRLLRYVALVGVGWLAIAGLLDVTRPAAAAPARRSGGVGVSTVSVVDFSEQPNPPTPEHRPRPIPGRKSS